MTTATVIIVGGGPAGSSCAAELRRHGLDAVVLDQATFPREKLCAGWITPQVLAELELSPEDYPRPLTRHTRLRFSFRGVPLTVPTRQYAVRRSEFDAFLLERASVPVHRHRVHHIERAGDEYVVDGAYRCRYLVGAGGTHCPVYRALFAARLPRRPDDLIVTLEEEFRYDWKDGTCRLAYFDRGLPGYAWYLPKRDGYLTVGIGGKQAALRRRGATIKAHWRRWVERLASKGWVREHEFRPSGHSYYIRPAAGRGATAGGAAGVPEEPARHGNVFIVGDAAALATRDMGEGIGPAVASGRRAARAIAGLEPYSLEDIGRWSIPQILRPRSGEPNGVRRPE